MSSRFPSVLVIVVFFSILGFACQSDLGADRACREDGDCPRGSVCALGFCALRLEEGPIDGEDIWSERDADFEEGRSEDELVGDPVVEDPTSELPAEDVVNDQSADLDAAQSDQELDQELDLEPDIACEEREEICDGQDNNCNGWIDEGGVCDDVAVGIRVELHWNAVDADLDLHFLNPEGVLGTSEVLDPNDCYWNNTNPDWGNPRSESDNPLFQVDIQSGGGEPEVVEIKQPGDTTFRVLVHYFSSSAIGNLPVGAEVRVFFDDELVRTIRGQFPASGRYWNAVCVNYSHRTVTGLGELTVDPLIPDHEACLGAGVCAHPCDCPQGHDCQDGECSALPVGVYCCGWGQCPMGEPCVFKEGESGWCGGTITFDHDLEGQPLSTDVDVESLYSGAGVLFSTSRAEATVMTNWWPLQSTSGGNSCATREAGVGGAWRYWLGDIHIRFVVPHAEPSEEPLQGWVSYGALFVGDTWPGGLALDAFDPEGVLLGTIVSSSSGTDRMRFRSERAIGRLRVRTNGAGGDPDFTIDDLSFGPIRALVGSD